MRLVSLLLLIAFPLIEIAMLIIVGRRIGVLATVALVMLTAVAGLLLLRRQGVGMLTRAAAAARQGEPPAAAALDGLVGVMAAVLLITPGPIADVLGVLLLIPPVRSFVARNMARRLAEEGVFSVRVYQGRRRGGGPAAERTPAPDANGDGPVIEGEFRRLDETTARPTRSNGGQ
ncbi:MAG: FxsA family protein [Hyphomicrobiaceae bacterium]|nr:FxsA family protein [Hyphomicrobiaceae bacterium]